MPSSLAGTRVVVLITEILEIQEQISMDETIKNLELC